MIREYLKGFWEKFGDHIAVFGAVLLAIGIAFLSGRLSAPESGKLPINIRASIDGRDAINRVSTEGGEASQIESSADQPKYGLYVASKNSKIYHLWNCPSAARIKDENKLWFDTIEEVEETGRTMASDCKDRVKSP